MKYWILRVVFVALCIGLTSISVLALGGDVSQLTGKPPLPAAPDQQGKATNGEKDVSQPSKGASPSVIIVDNPPSPNEGKSPEKESAYWPPNWSNWALVIVGLIAAGIAIYTLQSIQGKEQSFPCSSAWF